MAHPAWRTHWRTLISKIKILHTEEHLQEALQALQNTQQPHVLAFVNAHAMNCAAEDESFFSALKAADTIYRDGIGLELMYRMRGEKAGLNLNGTDLIPRLLKQYAHQPVALYGTAEPYLSQAAETISARDAAPSAIHCANGFLSTDEYVDLAQSQRPALIVLGMGMPKQELVAAQLRSALHFPCLIVCGGAIIDFLGGKVTRAPEWMRSMKAEWIYRLALEPKRLFKRYVMGNPKFLIRASKISISRQTS